MPVECGRITIDADWAIPYFMGMTAPTLVGTRPLVRKPRDEEIDVFGVTHPGKVRTENQDHFLLCSLRKAVDMHLTSLPRSALPPEFTERLAFLAMVADGVGGGVAGEEASRVTLEAVMEYVTRSMHCYYTADSSDDASFAESLQAVAVQCHEELSRRVKDNPARAGMATTLTLYLGVWPRVYLLQVGDSRYYMMRHGELVQVSHDQTMAQELIDRGVIKADAPAAAKWAHVLSSAIGGPQSAPVVTAVENDWDIVHLLCSDGLTRHVSDERIAERLRTMKSAKQVCQDLLQDALDGGGRDNITVIVGRAQRQSPD